MYKISKCLCVDLLVILNVWFLLLRACTRVMVTFNNLLLIYTLCFVNLVLLFVSFCDKMWMCACSLLGCVLFLFSFVVKINLLPVTATISSNLGHVRKYTHKRFFLFLYFAPSCDILCSIFVFFFSCNLAGIFPIFLVFFCYFSFRREEFSFSFSFVKIVLKSC